MAVVVFFLVVFQALAVSLTFVFVILGVVWKIPRFFRSGITNITFST